MVDKQTFALMVTCDAKDGWSYKEYDGLKCEGDLVKDFSAGWGKCVKSPSGNDWVKITGATALKAAAAALVAFAGSQFWDTTSQESHGRCHAYINLSRYYFLD